MSQQQPQPQHNEEQKQKGFPRLHLPQKQQQQHLPQKQQQQHLPQKQPQQQKPFYYDFQPQADWTEDARNHVLRVQLPGFQKKDLRVQRENSGKVTVRGSRSLGLDTYDRLDQSFPLPHDCDAGQIKGKFEEGCLYLVIPKKVVMQPPPSQREAPPPIIPPKEEQPPQRNAKPKSVAETKTHVDEEMMPKNGKRKEEDEQSKEKSKSSENKKPYIMKKLREVAGEEGTQKYKSKTYHEMREEEHQEANRRRKEEAKSTSVEKPPCNRNMEKDDDEEKQKLKDIENTKISTPDDPKNSSNKKQHQMTDAMAHDNAPSKKTQKRNIKEEMEDWLDFGSMDDAWGVINRNKKLITLAVLAFSVGFYVSCRLKSRS